MHLEPLVKTVRVPLAQPAAFALFTAEMGAWWPLATHAIAPEDVETCVFEGFVCGRIFERTADGRELPWGSVTAWQPPERVAFRWHPGRDADTGQEVEVTFAADGEGATAVRLEHRDWHVFGEKAAEMRANYDGGWDGVLELYGEAAAVARV